MENGIYRVELPPKNLLNIGKPRTWAEEIAKANYDWFMSVREERVKYLLSYFAVAYPEKDERSVFLSNLGERVAETISIAPYFKEDSGRKVLTAPGLSIAYDMGVLVAELIINSSEGLVRWELLKVLQNDVSYNLPVLVGKHPRMTLDPIQGSITEAKAILQGQESGDIWAKIFDHWLKVLA